MAKNIVEKNCPLHSTHPAGKCLMCRGTDKVLGCDCGALRPMSMEFQFRASDCLNHHHLAPLAQEIRDQIDEGTAWLRAKLT